MSDVEQNAIFHRVIDAMKRDRKFHAAEVRGKMTARARNIFHKKFADVPAKLRNIPFRHSAKIGVAVYSI